MSADYPPERELAQVSRTAPRGHPVIDDSKRLLQWRGSPSAWLYCFAAWPR